MKTIRPLLLCACATLYGGIALAHFPVAINPQSNDGLMRVDWTPVQIGIFSSYPCQFVTGSADVYGIAAGILNLRQQSAVVSLAPVNGMEENYFAQIGLIDVCRQNRAFEIGLLNLTGRNIGLSVAIVNLESNLGYRGWGDPWPCLPGFQVGLVNVSGGLQLGLLNYNPQGIFKWLPVINFPWYSHQ